MTDKKQKTELANSEPSPDSPPSKASSTSPAATPKAKPQTTTQAGSKSNASVLPILAIVIALTALAGAAWLWWNLQALQSQQQEADTQLQQSGLRAANADTQIQQLGSNLATIDHTLSNLQTLDEAQQFRIDQFAEQLEALAQRRPSDWLLAEANYLVTLATRRLWLEHDVETAIGLLTAADERIMELHDPALLNLRQALNDDISQLKALPQIDKEGMVLQLNALQRRISELPLSSVALPDVVDAEDQQQLSDDPSDWRDNLMKSWSALADGFITVRKRSGPVEPLLAPEQRWYLVENLKTKLLQAQLALYREQQTPWQDSLGQALSWTERFFDQTSPATQAVVTQLTELSQMPISATYPDDLTVRSLLQDELAERASATVSQETPQTDADMQADPEPEQPSEQPQAMPEEAAQPAEEEEQQI